MKRPLSQIEQIIIKSIAERMADPEKTQLIWDMEHSQVESVNDQNSRMIFHIDGYQRPPYRGQHGYPVEGVVRDFDSTEIAIWLYADENNRLYELEFVRWNETGLSNLINPDWSTLKFW